MWDSGWLPQGMTGFDGGWHWFTAFHGPLPIAFLALILFLGFIIFGKRSQGRPQEVPTVDREHD